MLSVVQNYIGSRDKIAREFDLFAGIEIAVEAGKVAAGNFQAQDVTLQKDVARRPEI
jgi:hypothetical protein